MNSKNAVHAQLFFEFKQFSKNDMRLSGQALVYSLAVNLILWCVWTHRDM